MYVASPDAPLRFAVPPGWPTPTADWVREHQGVSVPLGWVPVDGVPAAPPGWVFWGKNQPVWDALIGPALAPFRRRTWWGVGIFAAGMIATVAGIFSSAQGGSYILFWGALIFGPIQAIAAGTGWSRANRAAAEFIRSASADIKRQQDWMAYQRYLSAREEQQ